MKIICYLLVLGAFLQGCAPSVKFNKQKIPGMGKIGLISVYEAVGILPGIVDLALGSKEIEDMKKALLETNPAPKIMEEFKVGIMPLIGPSVINIEGSAVENIKETKGLLKRDYFPLEKLNHAEIAQRYDVRTLITLRTYDDIRVEGAGSYKARVLVLCTEAKMIDIPSKEILWKKNVYGKPRRVAASVYWVKEAINPQIGEIVDQLIRDFAY